ncbi:MAG: TonB-dependent receptor [Gemmatimonadetes bacterium]|nr:TonB-dependent receptor [Gemmatimonadota bacterium]MYI62637.1 TonB-dependent receptor [Gemmatimonadota bacterium]
MKECLSAFALAIGLSALLSVSLASEAVAQDAMEEKETAAEEKAPAEEEMLEGIVEVEELVVTGSRAQSRTVTDSPVPIDVIGADEFAKQGGADLADLVRNVVPSYNVNTQPISDAGTVVRPPNMRGLAPDHALVLVNGKRRHRAAVIHWLGNGVADGAQGPDLAPIPAIALDRVEVLRDGASAQYGSDAIAGVLNFRLKNRSDGLSVETKVGSFQDGEGILGDGELFSIAGNLGLGNDNAWANLSLEYGNSGETIRSVQRNDAAGLIAAGNTNVANPAQIWGQPFIRDDLKFFANYGANLGENLDFYGHANYASKETEGGFYFRNPHTRSGVFKGPVLDDGSPSLLVGDLDGVGQGGECAPVPIIDNKPDQDAWLQIRDDPNCFSFLKMFPGGFTPRFGGFTTDESILLGLKGFAAETLGWSLSASYGRHHADYFIFNTVNASMGPDTPTSFNPGDYIQTDVNLNFDITYPVSDQLFLAAGAERRNEAFEIVEGQIESYLIGQPLASQGFQPATNGFSGFSKVAAGRWDRTNTAVYVEADFEPIDPLVVSVALRSEDFSDFGSTTNYKGAANFALTDDLKLRGSYSTGFRAPTPGQQNAFNITTEFNFEKNDLVNNGTVPSTSRAVGLVLGLDGGGPALKPENSVNLSGGVVVNMGVVSATIDYFNIKVEDRLTVSQDFALTDEQKQQLIDEGLTSAAGLQEFRFFTNDFDSATNGIDLVVSAPVGSGMLSLAYNYTSSEVTDHNPDVLDALRLRELEENLPKQRGNLTLTQALSERWSGLGRASYYGEWYDSEDDQTYSGKVLFDLETSISFDEAQSAIAIGVQNILNTYPDEHELARDRTGNKYSQFSPFGFGGAFWYVKYSYSR